LVPSRLPNRCGPPPVLRGMSQSFSVSPSFIRPRFAPGVRFDFVFPRVDFISRNQSFFPGGTLLLFFPIGWVRRLSFHIMFRLVVFFEDFSIFNRFYFLPSFVSELVGCFTELIRESWGPGPCQSPHGRPDVSPPMSQKTHTLSSLSGSFWMVDFPFFLSPCLNSAICSRPRPGGA